MCPDQTKPDVQQYADTRERVRGTGNIAQGPRYSSTSSCTYSMSMSVADDEMHILSMHTPSIAMRSASEERARLGECYTSVSPCQCSGCLFQHDALFCSGENAPVF